MTNLDTFSTELNVVVIGSSGGIGKGFIEAFENDSRVSSIYAFSRNKKNSTEKKVVHSFLDLEDEASIQEAAQLASSKKSIDLIVVATGVLHRGDGIKPEKSIKQIDPKVMIDVIKVNAIGPILIAKHFLPKLSKNRKTVFAALSARVGSISDNRMGGWSSYRSSKAALNMLLRTASIELKFSSPKTIIVSLHPGTVDTRLSEPFKKNVTKKALFKADYSAVKLINVINNLDINDTGKFFAWDGNSIEY
jgi:NAD(P)-dependent dehydrogenase (short-subunit alcohol dehydrogenase family)